MSDSNTQTLREIARLKGQNSRLRSVNNKLAERGAGYDDFISELKRITEFESGFKFSSKINKRLSKPVKNSHSETAVLALSDIHLGEVISPAATMYSGGFNSTICANRMWHHVQSAKEIISIHRKAYDIEGIQVFLLGDCLNGSIHSANLTNDLTEHAQVILATRLLTIFFYELSTLGIPIHIDTAVGNHPRTTPTMPIKRQNYTNYDWLVYEFLKDSLSSNKLISMSITPAEIGFKKIYNHNYVFTHGIGVSSKKEHELENGIRNMLDNPLFRKRTGYTGASFDEIVIGNTHVCKILERMLINGAYSGNGELAISWRLPPVSPQQLIWGCSESRSRTWVYQIDLLNADQEKNNPMLEYTKFFMEQYNS